MFGKIKLYSIAFFLASFAFVCLYFIRLRPSDLPELKKLCRESAELRSKRALERHPAKQYRTDVQKDIWTVNGKERKHVRLKSERSDLVIRQRKDKFEATEHLQQLQCWVQEEVDPKEARQQIRYVTADRGTYFFPSHRFLTEEVNLSFYRLSGTELPDTIPTETPFLRGTAREISFNAAGKSTTFTAYDLRAALIPEEEFP